MAKTDPTYTAGHQSKKKRADEDDGKAVLQRRRVWRACESCRRKKVKCDGKEPVCGQCSASSLECNWLQTKDRAALSRQYVQELEARVIEYEAIIKNVKPALKQIAGEGEHPSPQSSDADPSPAAAASALLRAMSRTSESTVPVKLEDDTFGELALDEYGHGRWMGGSSSMSLIQSFRALTTAPQHRISPAEEDRENPAPSVNKFYFPASVFFGQVHALPGPEEVEYPPRDLADKLVDAYFAEIHYLMPVIDKPTFLAQYQRVMDSTKDIEFARKQTSIISLVFSVFACAAALVKDDRLYTAHEGGMGMIYYERALILQYICHASISADHVQCFVLLSSFLCSINCLPQAWILLGQAVRTGQDLGLHRSPRRLQVLTPIQKETRRKIWWGVYVLDRMLAVALGRPLGINDADCDVEHPIEVDDDILPQYFQDPNVPKGLSLMAGTVALIKLYEIAGRILRVVYALENCKENLEPERKVELERTVEGFHQEVRAWCDSLPAAFKTGSNNTKESAMGAVLCTHFYGILTTLHRNLLPVQREDPVTAQSTQHAVDAARACIRLAPSIKHYVPVSHHLGFFIQHLFASGIVVLLFAMHSKDAKAAIAALSEARTASDAIGIWEMVWPGAQKAKELLNDCIQTAAQAVTRNAAQAQDTDMADATSQPQAQTQMRHERNRSVTIEEPTRGSMPAPPRLSKSTSSKQTSPSSRRNRSREQSTATRRLASSPYHNTALRARSSSRRRGYDEEEASLYQSFVHSPKMAAAASNHSSPSSAPSPSLSAKGLVPDSAASPTVATHSQFSYGASSAQPSSPLYSEFGFDSQIGQPATTQWNGNSSGLGMDNGMLYDYGYGSGIDGMYAGFDSSMGGATTSFDAPGLPFRGLDFLRNYNNADEPAAPYLTAEQDSGLWQSYEPVNFDYVPELPFTLTDLDPNGERRT
ncbi:hypothetical protein CYLTODRAFT_353365 [Cylindrobasidium torrendii FP15055 ss-10]|uniref:Zn(2)-C6 fungal-type domain-containing protein n=1 Tax=Cylindrobasidium torrendii FP15055 ss-10 TaxID=1314674 RepID=A0A0D7BB04_9AGAR|nr:hypothetical protein CYLTODRAFT_353365 [Cylindrobasidium torrendii FP15055 ss-10]